MITTPPRPPPIAIVGGGPCGLTFARLLERAGIDYVVFERDTRPNPNPRFQGGTLDLSSEGGQAALRRAGLSEQFEKLARRDATTIIIQDAHGNHRVTFGEDNDRPEIDRLQLRRLLLESVSAGRIRWGKVLSGVDRVEYPGDGDRNKDNDKGRDWVLRFADGSREGGFRLVVGADGAWSKLRQLITPAKPQYSGKMFIEGRLSHENPQYDEAVKMVGAGNSVAMGAGRCLCIQQMSDRSYRVYMGIETSESFTRAGGEADLVDMEKARAAILGLYSDWAPQLRAFIAAAEGPWRPWPLYRLSSNIFNPDEGREGDGGQRSWTRAPGVVLLGDAAHLTTPNGEGVNHAMLDALVLFERICAELGGGNGMTENGYDEEADAAAMERAIQAYEADMRPRGYESIMDSINMEGIMYAEDGAQKMINMFNEMMH